MANVEWIKLNTDMFNNRKIKYLRSLPEGNNIILIWVMLLTLAGRCNAGGMIFLTENVPYTNKMLADELHFDENIITLAINALIKLDMITFYNDKILISGWEKHQNIDGLERIREQNRLRQARFRASNNPQITENDYSNVTDNVTVTQSNATEEDKKKNKKRKEEDKEVDKKENKKKTFAFFPNDEQLNTAFIDYMEMRKKIKAPMTNKAIDLAIAKLRSLSTDKFGNMNNDKAIKILEQSTMNSWKGLFPLKEDKQPQNSAQGIDWSQV